MPSTETISTATAGAGKLSFVRSVPGAKYRGVKYNRISKRQQRRVASVTTKEIRRRVLPRLRKAVPKRTGALRKSLKIRRVGRRIELKGNFYSRFVSWRPARGSSEVLTVALQANRVYEGSRAEIREAIRRQI